MGQAESNESAAVKRQAEGGDVPMYKLLDLSGRCNINCPNLKANLLTVFDITWLTDDNV